MFNQLCSLFCESHVFVKFNKRFKKDTRVKFANDLPTHVTEPFKPCDQPLKSIKKYVCACCKCKIESTVFMVCDWTCCSTECADATLSILVGDVEFV